MVLGIYYLTQERPGNPGEGKYFKSVNEAILAYENKVITLQSRIHVRCTRKLADGRELTGTVESTLGRFLFNEILPQDLGYVDRSIPGNELLLEVDFLVGKKQLESKGNGSGLVYPKEGTLRMRIKSPGDDQELGIEIIQFYLGRQFGRSYISGYF